MRLGLATTVAVLAVGCGGSEPPAPPPSTTSTPPPTSTSTTTVPAAAVPPSTVAGTAMSDDARRILQERGIDPDKLSKDIAEQMQRRFQHAAPQPR